MPLHTASSLPLYSNFANMKQRLKIIIAMLLAVLLTACGESFAGEASSASTKPIAATTESVPVEGDTIPQESIISIENVTYITTDFNRTTIEVKFRNVSDETIENVVLYVDLLDASGDILETSFASCYTPLESGQAVTESVWINNNIIPSSIRIAKGDYCESGNIMPIEFTFDPHFTDECTFESSDASANNVSEEEAVSSEEDAIIQEKIEQAFTEISERVENGEFTFTAVEFVPLISNILSDDYSIVTGFYPNTDIIFVSVLNSNNDILVIYLLFDTEGNYLDPTTNNTTKVDCVSVLYYPDTCSKEKDFSMEYAFYSALSVCDPSYEYDAFCDTLARVQAFPGATSLWHGVEFWYEESDSFNQLYIRAFS